MKFFTFALIIGMSSLSANTFSQVKVTMEMKNSSLNEVFKEITKQTGYEFMYSNNLLKNTEKITISAEQIDLKEILEECLKFTTLWYTIQDNIIVISPKLYRPQETKQIIIKGKVQDKQKNPLPGVTIFLKGTTYGGTTNTNGEFNLSLPAIDNPILLFTFIGMESQEIRYTGQEIINVTLVEDVNEMEEVVVTGIFERPIDSFTGSYSTYKGEDLKMVGSQGVLQSLRTLDPSFRIEPNNLFGSDPNRLPDVNIRGKSGFVNALEEYETDPNQPLFIMDGFEVSLQEVVDISMDRIESITVLKDAAATAIYGNRAANGVVIMELKRPKAGSLNISYNGMFQLEMPDLSDYNMMNAAEKLEFERLFGLYDPSGNTTLDILSGWRELYNRRLENVQSGVNTYWLSVPVRTGFVNKHDIYVYGGGDVMYYGFGASYQNKQGAMKKSDREIFQFKIDLNYRQNKVLFKNSFTINSTDANNNPQSFSVFVGASPYYKKDFDGDPPRYLDYYTSGGDVTTYISNPLYNESLKYIDNNKELLVRNNFSIGYDPLKGLKLRSQLSISKLINRKEIFTSPYHTKYDNVLVTEQGEYTRTTSEKFTYDANFTLEYNQVFNEVHQLFAVARAELKSSKSNSDGYTAQGFPDDIIPNPSFANQYKIDSKPSYSENLNRSNALTFNFNYGYKLKYLLEGTYRLDGATNFGTNKLFTNTWSVGVRWNIHNENFIGPWADKISMRAAYGTPKNTNLSYETYTSYKYVTSNMNLFGIGAEIYNYGNSELDWEEVNDLNFGFDIDIFNNRYSLVFDYYHKISDPLIVSLPVAPSSGKTSFYTNFGRKVIDGITFQTRIGLIQDRERNIIWNLNIMGSHEKSKYNRFDESMNDLNEELRNANSLVRYQNGYSEKTIWAAKSAGIDPMSGREVFITQDGTPTFNYKKEYEQPVGDMTPTLEGTIGTSFMYSGLTLSIFVRYKFGGEYYNTELYNRIENVTARPDHGNMDKRALYDRWQEPGDRAQYRAISSYVSENSSYTKSSRYIQKEKFITGENISVGYRFMNKHWLDRMYLSGINLNLTMNDIFRVSTIRAERGINYPFARNISLQVGFTFK